MFVWCVFRWFMCIYLYSIYDSYLRIHQDIYTCLPTIRYIQTTCPGLHANSSKKYPKKHIPPCVPTQRTFMQEYLQSSLFVGQFSWNPCFWGGWPWDDRKIGTKITSCGISYFPWEALHKNILGGARGLLSPIFLCRLQSKEVTWLKQLRFIGKLERKQIQP